MNTIPKPCPFCGEVSYEDSFAINYNWLAFSCSSCGAHGPAIDRANADAIIKPRALTSWNTRREPK